MGLIARWVEKWTDRRRDKEDRTITYTLSSYNPKPLCPKCGCHEASARLSTVSPIGIVEEEDLPKLPLWYYWKTTAIYGRWPEHINRNCLNCGYTWSESTIDDNSLTKTVVLRPCYISRLAT